MKLSYSSGGWAFSWEEALTQAVETGFQGIEIAASCLPAWQAQSHPFSQGELSRTVRALGDHSLSIPCLYADDSGDVAALIALAHSLRCPYVAVPLPTNDPEGYIRPLLDIAARSRVALLIPTIGAWSDTAKLKDFLDGFASDHLLSLWRVDQTAARGETAEETVKNLGAYVRHAHLCDAKITESGLAQTLLGEGDVNLHEVIDALRAIGYDDFLSLAWQGGALPPEIVLPHFVTAASTLTTDPRKRREALYDNHARTGKYIWKKDELIDLTFPQVLDRVAALFPDQYAFRYTTLDYTRTYQEFLRDVKECARALMAVGVRRGAHVAVWATNVPQWYIAFWATVRIGAVLVTMNTAYKIHEAEYLLRQSDTHTLVMIDGYRDSDYAGIIRELCPELEHSVSGAPLHLKRLPFLRNIVTVGFSMRGCVTWEELIAQAEKTPREALRQRAATVRPDDVANMQYTSGTTGFPKGVMLTHHNIVNNGKCIGDRMDLSTADRMMIQVPMFHCFGMVLAMTAAMTHGASLMPLPYFSPKPALACIHQEKITCFHGVPTMFIALLENEDFEKTDFSHMRTGIMAGSPCPIAVMRDVVDKMRMTEITIVYGQTEASPGCTMSSTDDPLDVRVATVGRALPGVECRIVDPETGEELPDEVTGEFVARGYNIMKGYYKMPRATASAIDQDGWLHTGDLACRTKEGNYRITGRLKDMIIRGGENIYPKEIEEFIYTHPDVSDVQVIGVPDKQYGEEIMACVILKEGRTLTEDALKAFVRDHMARHKTPKYIRFVSEFPTNAAGKILKYQMRKDAIDLLGLGEANAVETA